ncbi:TPA: NAD-dependent epimerase/dehydratase family protein [Streptococcus suis]|uniref:Nucleoside-diphosphate sugar epimerase n=1 Tax=Streptococcus suis TaxID=1307 RepID=A0A1P8VQS3_STRSU|nr:NAD(P)-dependent oxidoreductase [Streptococcus suis]APZ78911.1 Nucleoside-diphosphate sugar epimerase [Streptococcus suis]APZ78933.1 Nucleoside-diphosphate sugar epimerase [Streptococcus suis]APZ78955.1 Nucleoside-diphosphate sugar epimerase [Streptococcus suis]MCK3870115.1 NAD(P)-dependent oxidoreductase [Streptococcus suis]MDE1694334.1 NAD(P)-dependent oxidoreductase [Streptococcus suis]
MKFLVTGANGFLGRGVVTELLDSGHKVVATDITVENIDSRAVRIEADIFEGSNSIFFDDIDVLIHLAWKNGFVHNSENHIEDIPLHYKFIKNAINHGIKQIAILGSMHEVGFFEGSIDETTPTNPANLYGIAKDSLRNITKLICKENNIVWQWIRGFYIVDNSGKGSSIFAKITNAENNGETTFPFTQGLNQYDFINYEDFCKQIVAISSQNKINGIINASSGYPQSLANRVEKFIKENKYNIKLAYGIFPDRAYDSKAIWGNSNKIEEILNNGNNENY